MAATDITTQDDEKTFSMTVPDAMSITDEHVQDMIAALGNLNAAAPVSTISLSEGVTYTITLKDARVFEVTVFGTADAPAHSYVSSDAWSVAEFSLLRALGKCITYCILQHNMSAMTVTYA